MVNDDLDIWKKIEILAFDCINKFGYKIQFVIAMEEASEFIQSLSKYLRYHYVNVKLDDYGNPKNIKIYKEIKENVMKEMIDLEIMIEQIKQLFYSENQQFFAKYRELLREKLKRLESIIK